MLLRMSDDEKSVALSRAEVLNAKVIGADNGSVKLAVCACRACAAFVRVAWGLGCVLALHVLEAPVNVSCVGVGGCRGLSSGYRQERTSSQLFAALKPIA